MECPCCGENIQYCSFCDEYYKSSSVTFCAECADVICDYCLANHGEVKCNCGNLFKVKEM